MILIDIIIGDILLKDVKYREIIMTKSAKIT